MKTNTQYVKDAKKIKLYHNQIISVAEAAEMTPQMLDAHFANVAIKNSIVHVITEDRPIYHTAGYKFHTKKVVNKRYRLPKRN